MANAFSKQEKVAFEELLMGFEDALVLSRNVNIYRASASDMQRSQNTIWRPQPHIATSFDGSAGTDITSDLTDMVQLSVPASIDTTKTVGFTLNAQELNDMLVEGRLATAAKQRLSSDINIAIMNVAVLQGSLFVKRSAAAAGFDDIAECDAIMNEQGISMEDRFIALSSRDYNSMASNLASRTLTKRAETAYDKAFVGPIAGFDAFKLDYANTKAAALGTTVTVNGANQRHVPKAIDLTVAGKINVDNRTQNLTVAVASGTIAVGDRLTIVGVNAVNHITKVSTGQLKTFVVKSIVSGSGGSGVIAISPPIIAADSTPTDAESQYKNVTATPANGAALVFLNTVLKPVNPFWHKNAFEILPGQLSIIENSGVARLSANTEQGFQMNMQKQWNIKTNECTYRFDLRFGVVCVQPEMAGAIMFSQT